MTPPDTKQSLGWATKVKEQSVRAFSLSARRSGGERVGERIPRNEISRVELLKRSSRCESALIFTGKIVSQLTSAATSFMGKGFSPLTRTVPVSKTALLSPLRRRRGRTSALSLPSAAAECSLCHLVSILCLTVAFLMPACSPPPKEKLTVGMELAYPPFEMTDEQNRPTGVSADLAKALGAYLGQTVEIRNLPFDGLIPALKTGKIDLVISSMTATPERAQSIDFSEPYLKTGLCLLLAKTSAILSIEDLNQPGKTVAVKLGTTGHNYAVGKIHRARVRVLEKEDACVLEVVQGKADAFLYDQMSTFKNWQRNPEKTRPILEPFQEESWSIGARKGNTALLNKVNQFLKEFRAKGGFEELGNRYLKEQKEAFRQLGYPFYF